ncbi:MAG TPA: FAD-dependent oxidoreductase, partial [Miltoncostaea sp.]|nr:FAD-dependent oxidoreductase [Miltoncostaea sp.]
MSDGGRADVVVLGGGPGGYTAAFRAADLGLSTVLVERYDVLGGVCLNVGCIPSKALLHAAAVITGAAEAAERGIGFGAPEIDLDRLRTSTGEVVATLTSGLDGLAKRRKVRVVHGTAAFTSPGELAVETADGTETIAFAHAIIAAGSRSATIPGLPDDPRVM